MTKSTHIFPLGDSALTVSFGSDISTILNDQVISLSGFLERNRFAGLIETIPAYASLTVCYNVPEVRRAYPTYPTAFEAVRDIVKSSVKDNLPSVEKASGRTIEIPFSFDANDAPDLEFVARHNNLTTGKVIEIFTSRPYRVYMLGFLPGFGYMGEIDESIAAPRLSSPRPRVPRGSIGIAGRQTGIYSLESPGGWQIIGRTKVELFTPENEHPTYLKAGDMVRFASIH